MKKILLPVVFLLSIPLAAHADIVTTQTMLWLDSPYILIFIVAIETIAAIILSHYVLKKTMPFSRIFYAVVIANFISALVGIAVPVGKGKEMAIVLIIIGYPISALIEAFCMGWLLKKTGYTIKELLKLSFLMNLASYLPLAIYIFLTVDWYQIPQVIT